MTEKEMQLITINESNSILRGGADDDDDGGESPHTHTHNNKHVRLHPVHALDTPATVQAEPNQAQSNSTLSNPVHCAALVHTHLARHRCAVLSRPRDTQHSTVHTPAHNLTHKHTHTCTYRRRRFLPPHPAASAGA